MSYLVTTGKSSILIAIAVMILIYAAFPTHNYYWDGISFAQSIEDAGGGSPLLFHPNHLLYDWIGLVAYKVFRTFGNVRALWVLQGLNVVFAGAAVFAMLDLFERLDFSLQVQASFSCAFACSVTWWRFATDADAYILSTLLLILAFRALLSDSPRRFIYCALAHLAAIAVHELAVLFLPVAMTAVLLARASRPWRFRQMALYGLLTCGGTLLLYAGSYRLLHPALDWGGLRLWITNHSQDSAFSFDFLPNVAASLRSYVRLFAGGRPSLLKGQIGQPKLILSVFGAVVLAIGFVVAVRRLPNSVPDQAAFPRIRLARACAFVWLITYLAFLFFWLPNNTFYKILVLPPVVLLGAIQWSLAGPARASLSSQILPLGVAALFLSNFIVGIFPYSEVGSELVQFSLSLAEKLPKGSIVLYSEFITDDWYMRYFSPQTSWIQVHSFNEIRARVSSDRGRNDVWVDSTAASTLKQSGASISPESSTKVLKKSDGQIMLWRLH